MPSTLYINKPGGAILHLKDGSQETFAYGAPVDPDNLADYQKATIASVTDGSRKSESPAEVEINARLKDAHNASVAAHGGQVNSSANVVPGDYGQLDLDGAIGLVRALEAYPEAQAQVVLHEMVNYGRDKVVDAATSQARTIAGQLLEQTRDQVLATHAVAPGSPIIDEDGNSTVDTGDDLDKMNVGALDKAIDDYNAAAADDAKIDPSTGGSNSGGAMNADEKRAALRSARAAAPAQTTPPPAS